MAGGANHSRLTSIIYPNSRTISYNYASGLDDSISRLTSISDSGVTLEGYSYLGLGTVVIRSHPQPGVDLTYVKQTGESNGDAGDQYIGLDRFGRVVDQRWIKTSTGVATDRFQYTYDRDGNVLSRTNVVNTSFNETYSYDNLNQLASFARGSHTQSWTFDALGNWTGVTTDGNTQTRTANAQNEITSISGLTTPGYDANGSMTTDQTGKTLVYDAWNRMVAYKNGSTTLIAYSFDALGRRITDNSGTLRVLYYSSDWQVLEERIGSNVINQYVWSPVYIDAMIERDRSTQGNGVLDERLYVQQDGNWNVTAEVSTTGSVLEREAYDPYGTVTFMTASWGTLSASNYAWIYLHQGGRFEVVSGLQDFRNREYSVALGRWIEVDPLGFDAGDANVYRYVCDDPTSLTDSTGREPEKEIDVWDYLNADRTGQMPLAFKLKLRINNDDTVTVTVTKQIGLRKGFTFPAIVAGAWEGEDGKRGGQSKYKDTDSIQVALRWLDKDGKDGGHDTNALPQKKREVGAKWDFNGDTATWTSKKKGPKGDCKLNVVALYTDVLSGPKADLSIILGSFSAERKEGAWTINEIKQDLPSPVTARGESILRDDSDASSKLRAAAQGATEKILMDRTGYKLVHRGPQNTIYDTGYDIKIRE
jgi:RHS repeat-associated protein